MLEFSIATVSVFVGLLNQIVKFISSTYFHFDIKKYIPIFSLTFGVILGIIGYYTPSVEMGNNLVEAIFIGLASGAAATGIHQIGKQLTSNDKADTVDYVTDEDIRTDDEVKVDETSQPEPPTHVEETIDECNEDYTEDE